MGDATSFVPSGLSMNGLPTDPSSGYTVPKGVRDGDSYYYSSNSNGVPSEQPTASVAPFYSQLNAVSPSPHRGGPAQSNHTSQYGHLSSIHRLDMSAVAAALPDTGSPSSQYLNHHHHVSSMGIRDFPSHSPLGAIYPNGQMSPMGPQHMSQFRHPYSPIVAHSPRDGQPSQFNSTSYPVYGPYQSFTPQSSISPQVMPNSMPAQYAGSFSRPDVYPQMPLIHYPGLDARSFMPGQIMNGDFMPSSGDSGLAHRLATLEPTPSYPRGPPRKPKQSGHALWVGNLPPGTIVTDLKDHFSREATKDIESLFLISKSNCAFVNYRTEAACSAAMNRFHDSRFNGVRLVCRLRRGSVPTNSPLTVPRPDGIPNSPTKVVDSAGEVPERTNSKVVIASGSNKVVQVPDGVNENTSTAGPVLHVSEKYFIVKSLTLQDLDASVRNGVWATQSHNEATLNKAFESADNVYLIFSANKSGEYFGYARMASPISGEAVAINPQRQHVEAAETDGETDGPKSIPTPATEWAPEGRIVDDSARGTIFWEAQLPVNASEPVVHEEQGEISDSKQGQDWGKPFKLEWLSTNRLPFYRTRGLRNPWNANREVKIARDGTELEPSIGKRLVQMFHRPIAPVMPQGTIGIVPMHPQFQPY